MRELEYILDTLDGAVRQMLREDLSAQLAAFRRALVDKRLKDARDEVHSVHGSAAFCRLESLRHAAAELEQSLNNNETNADHIRAFEINTNEVLRALEHQDQ
ncbi:MAG: Hpt domain-containing protein [Proteobacteria bacterium]|nr:Hpt domain-containing protein [Pseudomonadota bacterium]